MMKPTTSPARILGNANSVGSAGRIGEFTRTANVLEASASAVQRARLLCHRWDSELKQSVSVEDTEWLYQRPRSITAARVTVHEARVTHVLQALRAVVHAEAEIET